MENDIKDLIHKFKKLILDIFAPRKCAGCKKRNESFCAECSYKSFKYGAGCVFCNFRNNTGKICRNCQKKYNSQIFQILWASEYEQPIKNAVKELKYKGRLELINPLGKLIYKKFIEYYPKHEKENFTITHVPMHPKKEFVRGYNQAQLLAQEFSKLSGIQLLNSNLQLLKTIDTKTQVETRKRDERIKNLEGAFTVKLPPLAPPYKGGDKKEAPLLNKEGVGGGYKNKTIILIDDVATTGTTFMHASLALRKVEKRAPKIICLAIAHGYG